MQKLLTGEWRVKTRRGDLMKGFRFNEKYLSQIPALQQLINLGFKYLTPEQAVAARQKDGNVLLEEILRNQLKAINRIQYKGQEYLFSEENIQSAIQKLKNVSGTDCRRLMKPFMTCLPWARRWSSPLKATPRASPCAISTGRTGRITLFMSPRNSVLSAPGALKQPGPILCSL